jgi:acetyl esterase/lipase
MCHDRGVSRLFRAILLAALVGSCAEEAGPVTAAPPATTALSRSGPIVEDYLPGVEARILFPAEGDEAPLVVMVPGGAWVTADPAGFAGLASHLAASGLIAAPVHVRAAEDGVVYPTPVGDVLCAVAYAADTAREHGLTPGPVVVLGHSSGAHLAALAALAPEEHSAACTQPGVVPDALIGMAGTYDVGLLADLAEPLFGVSQRADPELWEAGNPLARAGLRPEIPVLLLHGDHDDLVPMSFTTGFARALEEGGHVTTVEVVEGANHHDIYQAAATGDIIVDWVEDLDHRP